MRCDSLCHSNSSKFATKRASQNTDTMEIFAYSLE